MLLTKWYNYSFGAYICIFLYCIYAAPTYNTTIVQDNDEYRSLSFKAKKSTRRLCLEGLSNFTNMSCMRGNWVKTLRVVRLNKHFTLSLHSLIQAKSGLNKQQINRTRNWAVVEYLYSSKVSLKERPLFEKLFTF